VNARLGIDVGGSSVKICYIANGQSHFAQSSQYVNPSRAEIVQAVQEAIHILQIDLSKDCSVGLCLPGKQSADKKMIENSINIPSLNGWVFEDAIIELIGNKPIHYQVVSDIDATGKDLIRNQNYVDRTAVIAIGTGVGLVVFDRDQRVEIGIRGIGHLGMLDMGPLSESDIVAPDGSINILESYIGARAIEQRMAKDCATNAWEFINKLSSDDPIMIAFARMIRNVHAIYVPDRVVVTGGIGLGFKSRCNELKSLIHDGLTSVANPDWELDFGESMYHAASGAAMLLDE
jgi:predicted NBD/HSP70 family sugar kinase